MRKKKRRQSFAASVFKLIGKRRRNMLVAFMIALISGLGGGIYISGRVISVADGDTFTFISSAGKIEKIRLYGVDSPELSQRGGKEAKTFANSLLLFQKVDIKQIDVDKYKRIVAIATLPDGQIFNEALVKNGQAWVYDSYCKLPECAKWKSLESIAKKNKKGLWRDAKPIAPWKWRYKNK